MKNSLSILLIAFLFCGFLPTEVEAQTVPTVQEVHNFFNNQKKLVTYREGEALYGTYYFLEIHYCPNGYGLYGNSVKKTVLGNEQRDNWQEFGTWKVVEQNGLVGIFYNTTAGAQNFIPIYKYGNGSYSSGEGITIVNKGAAICM